MNEPTKLETVNGGMDFNAAMLDGKTETVRIRQLPVRLLPKYLAAMDSEPAMIELLCDKPEGWSDNLTPGSFTTIIHEGERLNRDFFEQWVERRKSREKFLPKPDPEQIERVLDVLTRNNPQLVSTILAKSGLTLPTGSAKSPSNAA